MQFKDVKKKWEENKLLEVFENPKYKQSKRNNFSFTRVSGKYIHFGKHVEHLYCHVVHVVC